MPSSHDLLVQAIEQRRRLRFTYHGRPRLAEPQCYGIGSTGNELLRVHQLEGGAEPEPLFQVRMMEGLTLLEETFDAPGPHYKRDDSAMRDIIRQL